jgi:hypothetical protein
METLTPLWQVLGLLFIIALILTAITDNTDYTKLRDGDDEDDPYIDPYL